VFADDETAWKIIIQNEEDDLFDEKFLEDVVLAKALDEKFNDDSLFAVDLSEFLAAVCAETDFYIVYGIVNPVDVILYGTRFRRLHGVKTNFAVVECVDDTLVHPRPVHTLQVLDLDGEIKDPKTPEHEIAKIVPATNEGFSHFLNNFLSHFLSQFLNNLLYVSWFLLNFLLIFVFVDLLVCVEWLNILFVRVDFHIEIVLVLRISRKPEIQVVGIFRIGYEIEILAKEQIGEISLFLFGHFFSYKIFCFFFIFLYFSLLFFFKKLKIKFFLSL
jgi:hypothetical protein